MPDNIAISISPDGWIEAPLPKLDSLISDFGYAEYSQSTLYHGHVASLPYIIKVTQNNPRETTRLIQEILSVYLNRYFTNSRVESTVVEDDTSSSKVGITLNVTVTDATGKDHALSRLLEYEGSKLSRYITLSNG